MCVGEGGGEGDGLGGGGGGGGEGVANKAKIIPNSASPYIFCV